ncbi:MAG: RNA polymerase sigma factor [Deltaproteobacteria bacterium]|nr:RNA polymerase sigma factor [Deltaproteobacteria bacterium]
MSAKLLPLRRVEGSIAEMSDPALLAACALGDRAALGALFDRHYAGVRSFLSHLVDNAADVDDLVQRTFETLQASAGRYQHRAEVKTFILGIARNLARHHHRARARSQRALFALTTEPQAAGAHPDDVLLHQQRLALLKQSLTALSPKLRETFVLVYLEGLSGGEVAQVLGIREGAVWKQLHVAREKIKSLMGGVE